MAIRALHALAEAASLVAFVSSVLIVCRLII
jgi:hypothetical protein